MSSFVSCDTREVKSFGRQLRHEMPETAGRVSRKLRDAGNLVRGEAAKRAKAIMPGAPPKVKTSVVGLTVVSVKAARTVMGTNGVGDNLQTPLPALNEYARGQWQHPVYGNPPNVSQKATAFLKPALEEKSEEAVGLIAEALDEMLTALAVPHEEA